MATLQVVSSRSGAGKSTVAATLAHGFADAGRRVRLERMGNGAAAEADARNFATLLFVTTSGLPLDTAPPASDGEVLILERDAAGEPLALPAIIAVRGSAEDADRALAASLGDRLLGTIAVGVDPQRDEEVARDLTNAGMRPLALLPEDFTLTAPSVSELGEALGAAILHTAYNEDEVVEDVLIAPVYADPARPHFLRYAHKAVLAPFNKTDLHLAAIETEAACLVITGGKQPSPYIIDRAHHGQTTLLLSHLDTPGTVASLGSVWTHSRFRGEYKLGAAYDLLKPRLDVAGLLKKLEV